MSSIYPSSYEMQRLFPAEKIEVSFHQHPLRLKDAHQMPYHCVGCKEKTLGKFYQCEDGENCDFHLHQRCYESSETAVSIAFSFLESKKCSFEFQKVAPGGGGQIVCDACGNGVKGWFFKCERHSKKTHYLHPCCTWLPINQEGENGIVLHLPAKTSSKCQRCKREYISEGIRGWFYVSNCRQHCYHVGCVMGMIRENLNEGGNPDDRQDRLIGRSTDARESNGSTGDLTRNKSHAIIKRSTGNGGTKKILVKAALMALNIIISAIIGVPVTGACAAFFKLF